MEVRIRKFQQPNRPVFIRNSRLIAKFTTQLDYFSIFQMKLMDCPDRGLLVWSPGDILLSMEGRVAILQAIKRKMACSRSSVARI